MHCMQYATDIELHVHTYAIDVADIAAREGSPHNVLHPSSKGIQKPAFVVVAHATYTALCTVCIRDPVSFSSFFLYTDFSWSQQIGPGFIVSTFNVLLVTIITCIVVCCLWNTPRKLRQIQQNVDNLPQNLQNNMQQDFQAVQQDIQGLQPNIQGVQQNIQHDIQGVQHDIQGLQQNLQLLQDVPRNIQELVDALQDLRQNMQEEIRQVREQNLLNGPH